MKKYGFAAGPPEVASVSSERSPTVATDDGDRYEYVCSAAAVAGA